MKKILLLIASTAFLFAKTTPPIQNATQLKNLLQERKDRVAQKTFEKNTAIEELDKVNKDQNEVRGRVVDLNQRQQELSMSKDNLSLEIDRQKELIEREKKSRIALLKMAYKVQRMGLVPFLFSKSDIETVFSRFRLFYYSLKVHSQLTRQNQERSFRLKETETKLTQSAELIRETIIELAKQEIVLAELQKKKSKMIRRLKQEQLASQTSLEELQKLQTKITNLFDDFESKHEVADSIYPNRGTLPLPISGGKILRRFGKVTDEKFQTVMVNKGIEIASDHNTPIHSILPGKVEYEGWMKGMGNVMIVHHGGGFYSLMAHLFRTSKKTGDRVQQNEVVGYVGDTGNSETPSLYFELRENGKAIDPLKYFSPQALVAINESKG